MAKTGDAAQGVDPSDLFPLLALPSKWKGWRRFLRPFPVLKPRNARHYLVQGHLAAIKAAWGALSSAQRTAWDTWAANNQPWDLIWQADFDWPGQTAHAFCNAHLLFIGASLRDDAPTDPIPQYPSIVDTYWSTASPPEIGINWYPSNPAGVTTIVAMRFFVAPHALKSILYLVPSAYVGASDSWYKLQNPPGKAVWLGLYNVHSTQGISTHIETAYIEEGDT